MHYPCHAIVIQRGEEFVNVRNNLNHVAQPDSATAAKVISSIRAKAADNLYKAASTIVNEVLLENVDNAPCPSLSKQINLARTANCFHQRNRPKDPVDLNFEISEDNIPADFLIADVKVKERQHLLFTSFYVNQKHGMQMPPSSFAGPHLNSSSQLMLL